MRSQKIYCYLHTHWDREWYWNFNAYRMQLLPVVEAIIEGLENDSIENFMLDGQTCLLEDLFAVNPALMSRIETLVRRGRLSIGPWYVLADQMLVGGESLIRNLEIGLASSRALGGASMVGYCPDTFGHSADLPRILSGFGIDNAVVWRGVPYLNSGPSFLWKSADGSSVLAFHLNRGYYQTAFHEELDDTALENFCLKFIGFEVKDGKLSEQTATQSYIEELGAALLPVGGDHLGPPRELQATFHRLEKAFSKHAPFGQSISLEPVNLERFLTQLSERVIGEEPASNPVRTIGGELRDNDAAFMYERSYMLAGVLSTRLYLKRANRLVETRLLTGTEPFATMLSILGLLPYPGEKLDYSWKLALKNQPHDSICGCSIDTVHREMCARTDSLLGGLDIIERQGLEALVTALAPASVKRAAYGFGRTHLLDPAAGADKVVVVNSSLSNITAPVLVQIALNRTNNGGQLHENLLPEGLQVVKRSEAAEVFANGGGFPEFKKIELVEGYYLAENACGFGISVYPHVDAGSVPDSGSLPDSGSITDSSSLPDDAAVTASDGSGVGFAGYAIANQFFEVSFDMQGALVVRDKSGTEDKSGAKDKSGAASQPVTHILGHRFVDVGDGGDTYNFDALGEDKPIVSRLVSVRKGLSGPLVASLLAVYEIEIPEGLEAAGSLKSQSVTDPDGAPEVTKFKRSGKTIKHTIETEIILKHSLPLVFFETSFDNQSTDHRLEVVFDLAGKIASSYSENHFSVLERPVPRGFQLHDAPVADWMVGLGYEAPLERNPCQRFFHTGEEFFFNKGLPEYGASAKEVSYTILRAVSMLSRPRLRSRGGGAGPCLPTPEANCLGRNSVSYGWSSAGAALAAFGGEIQTIAYRLAEIYEGRLTAFVSPVRADLLGLPIDFSLLRIDDERVRLVSSRVLADGQLLVRLLNVTGETLALDIKVGTALNLSQLVNLDGATLLDLTARMTALPDGFTAISAVPVGPFALVTLRAGCGKFNN